MKLELKILLSDKVPAYLGPRFNSQHQKAEN